MLESLAFWLIVAMERLWGSGHDCPMIVAKSSHTCRDFWGFGEMSEDLINLSFISNTWHGSVHSEPWEHQWD